jgi:hypothetical protein
MSPKTFYRRLAGITPRNKAHEKNQFLNHAEEKELVQWITCLTAAGYPPCHASRLEPLLQMRIARLEKAEWTGAFVGAHGDAFTEKNIKAEFSATGIHPFRPSKVLHQAPSVMSEPTETRLPTPITTMPFPDTVLTSSSADIQYVAREPGHHRISETSTYCESYDILR